VCVIVLCAEKGEKFAAGVRVLCTKRGEILSAGRYRVL